MSVDQARRAAPQIDRLWLPLPLMPLDFPPQRAQISRLQFARKNARREIAVSALLRAERIGNVNAGHFVNDTWINAASCRLAVTKPKPPESLLAARQNAAKD